MFSHFQGRIVQIAEALSYQDAVSEHVVWLHRLLPSLGLRSEVYAKYHDARLVVDVRPLDQMVLGESDVAILHFCGRSAFALPAVLAAYCTRVMLYHNVTPARFFAEDSRLHGFCLEGRSQLHQGVGQFHRVWGVSQFNLDELLALGAVAQGAAVVPVVVPKAPEPERAPDREPATWLFLGRIAPNKRQTDLVRLFARARKDHPELAQRLVLAGGYEESDPYLLDLRATISACGLDSVIDVPGKVDDAEREHLYRTATVYVSLSEHEGFGVPLVEAAQRGLPVVALATSAIPETLGHGECLAADAEGLLPLIERLRTDGGFRSTVLAQQRANARRFEPGSVAGRLARALQDVLPVDQPFRTLSVVVCTYNRRQHLERLLGYLRHQRCPAFEVIVVDGPSTDGSKQLLDTVAHEVKLAHNPERNLSMSRNLGLELADGDVVAFIDDDALPFDDWAWRLLAEYNARPLTTAGLGGPVYYAGTFRFQAEDNGINRFAQAEGGFDARRLGRDGWYRYNTGTNASFVTRTLREHGGFDEQYDYFLDESDVCFRLQRAGLLIGYAPEVVVRHDFAQSHNRQGRMNYNWATICKNTAYFIAAHSGLSGDDLGHCVDNRMQVDRLDVFDRMLADGNITAEEHARYGDAVRSGARQGLADAVHHPRLRVLQTPPGRFKPYPLHFERLTHGAEPGRLHVCIVTREFPPFAGSGGVGTLYYHLASELLMMGHRVTVVVPAEEDRVFQQGNFSVHHTAQRALPVEGAEAGFARNIAWSVTAMTALARIHEQHPVDVVDSALWDCEALSIALLPRQARPKVVVRLVTPFAVAAQSNGWQPGPDLLALFMGAERALIAAADAVLYISESIAASIEGTYGLQRDDRWHLAPCGIAYWPFFDCGQGYNEFPQLDHLPADALRSGRIVLFVGRLERRKGVDLVLEAAPRILADDPDAHIVIAGRDVEGWIARPLNPALAGRVHFTGEVDDGTREKLLSRAWCLLFPSRYESFGLVALEAFVHGVPVIAARAGAIPEVVQEGRCGLLFDSESAEGLADQVTALLRDPALCERLSAGARLRIHELDSRSSARQSARLYRNLLS